MPKILHTSDWHLGNYVGSQCDSPMERMANTMKCLDVLVKTAQNEKPDVILVAGDIFHQARVWSDRALVEVQVAARYLNTLSKNAPVIVLYGTPNHDGEQQFLAIMKMTSSEVYFITQPEIETFESNSGPIQIAGLPGFDKGHFRAQHPGLSAEEENITFTQQLAAIVEGLSAQVDSSVPSILMAHHTVVGCELDNGQHVFQTNEVVLEATALDNSAFDLVCLGHIHTGQKVKSCHKPVYYAGSIDAFSFNDERHDHGFLMYNMYGGEFIEPEFKWTPAREFQTFQLDQGCVEGINQHGLEFLTGVISAKNKVVRVLYECDSETEKALNKKQLEKDLYAYGAYYVSEIRPEKIHESVNKERMHESLAVEDCLRKYLKEKNYDSTTFPYWIEFAQPFISKVQASQPAGGQTGIFLPVEISVRNYRSYAEETLSFQDIHFAMVNGVNGSGKSSLFMDAPLDCLYEQPREGDITGWIRSGEKSGSISFTFMLGGSTYRVTRTRQRSGKATLAIAKQTAFGGVDLSAEAGGGSFPFEQWEDISCERMIDTQNKIVDLLGMDADTFRSCVLIMQDQYGRFMEAKPEDRMSVLASLLGLGIYEQLEALTKESLRETNRELKNLKEDASVLEAEVSVLGFAQDQGKSVKQQIEYRRLILRDVKSELEFTRTKLAAIENSEMELLQVDRDISRKTEQKHEKQNKISDLNRDIKSTEEFLKREALLKAAHEEYQRLQNELIVLGEQEKQSQDKRNQLFGIQTEIRSLQAEEWKLRSDVSVLQQKGDRIPSMTEELKQLEGSEALLNEHEEKKMRLDELLRAKTEQTYSVRESEKTVERLKRQTEMLQTVECVDINRAQCAFLKEAKEAAEKLAEAEQVVKVQHELLSSTTNDIEKLGYSYEEHQKINQQVKRYHELSKAIQSFEADKRMIDIQTERLQSIETTLFEKKHSEDILRNELDNLDKSLQKIQAIRSGINELSSSEQKFNELPKAKAYLEVAKNQTKDLQMDIDDITLEILALKDKKEKLQDGLRYSDEVKQAKIRMENKLDGVERELSELTKQLGSIEEKLRDLDGKQEKLQRIVLGIEDTAKRASRLQALADAFGQDGIPHQIIRDIVPLLEASANEILGQMTGGRMRLEFRTERTLKSNKSKEVATLDIVIIDIDNGELPYLARSGGQKVRAALAVSFALAMVKASRVGLQLGMMFVDEPPFLDEEGTEAYCMALAAIHDKYPDMRIVAISHDRDMKARFPQQITIVAGDNGSKVRWE